MESTVLVECWYIYFTGRKNSKKHLEMKLVCDKCHRVWDRQGYAFAYCPGCGLPVSEIKRELREKTFFDFLTEVKDEAL